MRRVEGKGCRDAGGKERLTGNELYAGSELYASEFRATWLLNLEHLNLVVIILYGGWII